MPVTPILGIEIGGGGIPRGILGRIYGMPAVFDIQKVLEGIKKRAERDYAQDILPPPPPRPAPVVRVPAPVVPPPPPPPVIETTPVTTEEEPVSHDWGHLIRQGIGSVTGIETGIESFPWMGTQQLMSGNVSIPSGMPASLPSAAPVLQTMTANGCGLDGQVWSGAAPPKGYKVVNYCGQAVLRKIRRRRRRRLLTASDKSDIAAIVGMVGKGQMASSLISRVAP